VQMELSPTVRGEALTLEQFAALSNRLCIARKLDSIKTRDYNKGDILT